MSNPIIKILSKEDLKTLKQQQTQLLLFFGVLLVFVGGTTYYILEGLDSSNKIIDYAVISFLCFFLIALVVAFVYINRKVLEDIQSKRKHCFEGFIEDKTVKSNRSHKGRTKKRYFISINNNLHTVNILEYNSCDVGDAVYLEKTPSAEIILTFEVVKKSELLDD